MTKWHLNKNNLAEVEDKSNSQLHNYCPNELMGAEKESQIFLLGRDLEDYLSQTQPEG